MNDPSWHRSPGYKIKCELDGKTSTTTGASFQWHTPAGIQAVLNSLSATPEPIQNLDGVHTCFGKVFEGTDVMIKYVRETKLKRSQLRE